MSIAYPFTAIVGQDDMRRALTIAAVDPGIGGVLVLGERGTGKSTTIRALAALLPKIDVVRDCAYHCDPHAPRPGLCNRCGKPKDTPDSAAMTIPVVDLPADSPPTVPPSPPPLYNTHGVNGGVHVAEDGDDEFLVDTTGGFETIVSRSNVICHFACLNICCWTFEFSFHYKYTLSVLFYLRTMQARVS